MSINRPRWSRRTIRTSVTALDGLAAFEQKLCLMLPYRLLGESGGALVRLNSGSIWPCIETVSEGTRPRGRTALNGLAHEEISMHCGTSGCTWVAGGTS